MQAYSHAEHLALAAAYAYMADCQRHGAKVNKAELIRGLLAGVCAGRSRGAVEAKFMNLSAAAVTAGLLPDLPGGHVQGYKPAANGAKALADYLKNAIAAREFNAAAA